MPDLRMDVIGKVDRIRSFRQVDDVSARGKDKHLVGKYVEFQRFEKFLWVVVLLLQPDHLPEPRHLLIRCTACTDALSGLLVLPVRGDAKLGHTVHRMRPNLDLERISLRHDRCVQGLVAVRFWHGDIVFESPRDRLPHGVNDAEHAVTILDRGDEYAHGGKVVDLADTLVVTFHLTIDAVKVLGAPFDLRFDSGILEFFPNLTNGVQNECLPLAALMFDLLHEGIVRVRLQVAQAEILQFDLDVRYAEPVVKRSINLERLVGDALTLVLAHVFERAHVVEAVGELDHDDADILCHREEHLTIVLELYILLRHVLNASELCHAVDQYRNILAEQFLHLLDGRVRVLDDIVQKRRADRLIVHMQPRENVGDMERMDDVRLAGDARLPAVRLFGKLIGALDLCGISVRLIDAYLFEDHIEGNVSMRFT